MIELHTIYPVNQEMLQFLFDLLSKRDAYVNISHDPDHMPTWDEHVDFVCRMPYRKWWVIMAKVRMSKDSYQTAQIGAAYLSKQNEIGIQIIREHRRKGFGRETLIEIKKMFEGERLLWNTNPLNTESKKLVEGVGGRVIQHTYEIKD